MDKSWVTHPTQQPRVGDFGSTKGQGSPIAINNSDDSAWYLPKNSQIPRLITATSSEVYPESYGAVRDGVTDDSTAIQAAIDLQVSRGGGRVKLRPGTYYCSTTLTWNGAPIELAGSGNGIQPNAGTTLLFPPSKTRVGCVVAQNGPAGLGAQSIVNNLNILSSSVRVCTITIASPGVVTLANHGFANNDSVIFVTSGSYTAMGGLSVGVEYFARNVTANTFELSATSGGASINTVGTFDGTQWVSSYLSEADVNDGKGAGLIMQCNGGQVENVTCMYHAGNGSMLLSGYPAADITINCNNSKLAGLSNYWNGGNGHSARGVDSNNCLYGLVDCTYNCRYGLYENSFLGNMHMDLHTAGNAIASVRYGDITRGNRLVLYKEIGTALVVLMELGGAGSNLLDLRLVEGDTGGTITVTDNTGSGTNFWKIGSIWNLVLAGPSYPGVGMVRLSDNGVDIRKGATLALLNDDETETWSINVTHAGKLLFTSGANREINTAGSPLVVPALNVNDVSGIQVEGTYVVGQRQAGVGTASHCAGPGSPTKAEYDGTVDIVNAVISRLQAHGLIS